MSSTDSIRHGSRPIPPLGAQPARLYPRRTLLDYSFINGPSSRPESAGYISGRRSRRVLNPDAPTFRPMWQTANGTQPRDSSARRPRMSASSPSIVQGHTAVPFIDGCRSPAIRNVSQDIQPRVNGSLRSQNQLQHLFKQQQELLTIGCDVEEQMRALRRRMMTAIDPDTVGGLTKQMADIMNEFYQYQERSKILAGAVDRARTEFITSRNQQNL